MLNHIDRGNRCEFTQVSGSRLQARVMCLDASAVCLIRRGFGHVHPNREYPEHFCGRSQKGTRIATNVKKTLAS
jgi:hypothetical protein